MVEKYRDRSNGESRTAHGLEDVSQVDSILCEMAEVKVSIDLEKEHYQKKIDKLCKLRDESVEQKQIRFNLLNSMLEKFIMNNYDKFNRKFRFGNVRLIKGKLKVSLNLKDAMSRLGK